jgi:hypothetical protein
MAAAAVRLLDERGCDRVGSSRSSAAACIAVLAVDDQGTAIRSADVSGEMSSSGARSLAGCCPAGHGIAA